VAAAAAAVVTAEIYTCMASIGQVAAPNGRRIARRSTRANMLIDATDEPATGDRNFSPDTSCTCTRRRRHATASVAE